ncbi:MAG: hypothetical protein ACXVDA_22565 [Ktedonobacterales bacterium]
MTETSVAHGPRRSVECKPRTRTVLLAVSDNDLRDVLRMLFEEAGYRVLEAHSALTALTLLRRSREPLVVLLERYLRGTDAAEQLLKLAASGPLAQHRFLLLTSDSLERQPQGLRHQVLSQAIPVLTMPFEFDDMLREVARAQRNLG